MILNSSVFAIPAADPAVTPAAELDKRQFKAAGPPFKNCPSTLLLGALPEYRGTVTKYSFTKNLTVTATIDCGFAQGCTQATVFNIKATRGVVGQEAQEAATTKTVTIPTSFHYVVTYLCKGNPTPVN
ncbi:hypothetical protein TWF481_001209 [Arthrobotrys musiformis]|uniref:AA1-like domain-containing protein n=1 Tax=Arthrobotrys musiformis TaxID=47236 RepID=A0AAV9WQ57_9PEZI